MASRLDSALRPRVFAPLLGVLAILTCVGYANVGLPSNDEGALLTAAQRILGGGVFYRDVDSYPFPAAAYLLAFAMGVFGEHLSVARALAGVLYCSTVLSLYAAALHLIGERRAALFGLSLLSFKFLAWPAFTNYMYADVAFAFGAAGIALLVRRRPGAGVGGLVAAGVCVGISIASKQNLGLPLAAVALAWLAGASGWLGAPSSVAGARRKAVAAFAAGIAAVWLPMVAYFGFHGLLGAMVQSGLVAPFTGYLPTSRVAFVELLKWWEFGSLQGQDAFPYAVGPLWSMLMREEMPGLETYPAWWMAGEILVRLLYTSVVVAFAAAGWLAIGVLRGHRTSDADRDTVLFAGLAFAVILSAFPRADFYHVIGVYPVVLLLLVALWARMAGSEGRAPGWRSAVAVGAWLVAIATLTTIRHSHAIYGVDLERARLRLSKAETFVEPVVRFIQEETRPGDGLFVYGHEAYYYFLTDRDSPWRFSQLYPGQAGGDGGAAITALLERDPPALVVSGMLSWAGVPPIPRYTPDLVAFLHANYQPDATVFRRHAPQGAAPPPAWMVSVLRKRAVERSTEGESR